MRSTLWALLILAVAGCGRSTVAYAKEPVEACGHVKARTAEQRGATVTLTVSGEHATAGYKTSLERTKKEAGAAEFSVTHQKPSGPVSHVVSPFELREKFESASPLATVVVHDANGRHEVPVAQVPK